MCLSFKHIVKCYFISIYISGNIQLIFLGYLKTGLKLLGHLKSSHQTHVNFMLITRVAFIHKYVYATKSYLHFGRLQDMLPFRV